MSDSLPVIYTPESDTDDHALERSDISPDIHIPERSSTCNNQESILKKAKLIRNFGITSFSFIGVIILLYIITLIVALSSSSTLAIPSIVIVILVLGSIFSIADFVFMILAIVNIATTDWGNENLNKYKNAFWITTLCCLVGGFIASTLMIAGSLSPLASALAIIGLLLSLPLGITPPIMWIIWGNKVKNTYSIGTKA